MGLRTKKSADIAAGDTPYFQKNISQVLEFGS